MQGADWSAIAWLSLAWYLALLLVGIAGLVPAAVLFERLASRGVYLARPLGLALVALTTWLVVHLTPISYGTPMVVASLAALLVASGALAWWRREVAFALPARWRELAAAEGVVLVVFVLVLLARVQAPDAWGTEKPADLMLLTAVHRADTFPPLDPWYAGERISYYHLGQVQMDHLGRLAGAEPAQTFNLATATAGAMAAAAAAGVATDLVRLGRPRRRRTLVVAGAVAAAGLLLVAPAVGLVQVAAANGLGGEALWGRLGIDGVPPARETWFGVPEEFWWWWRTTRVIPGVISEYPGFSLVLGDPHAHLLALPLGLTALALAVQVFEGSTPLGWRRWLARPDQLVLTAALFAALVMTNAWDVVTYGGLWAVAAWWAAARAGWPVILAGFIAVRWAVPPTLLGLALGLPFLSTLETQPFGLAPVVGDSSDPARWLLFWLPVLLPGLVALALARPSARAMRGAVFLALVPVVLWAGWLVGRDEAGELAARGVGWVTLVALVLGVGWAAARAVVAEPQRRGVAAGAWLLASGGTLLLLTELVHVDDLFPGRLNTAFKFWFHTWALFAVGGAALLALSGERLLAALGNLRRPGVVAGVRWAVLGTAGGLWVASMATPPLAAVARAREAQTPALSTIAYLGRTNPGLAQAVAWGRSELDPGRHVIVEAVGESYDTGNRLSAFTGVPTLLGWPGHQRQWRQDADWQGRRAAVDSIYAGDQAARLEAVERWGVTHVVVGPEERAQYGAHVANRFAGWPVIFFAHPIQVYAAPSPGATEPVEFPAPAESPQPLPTAEGTATP